MSDIITDHRGNLIAGPLTNREDWRKGPRTSSGGGGRKPPRKPPTTYGGGSGNGDNPNDDSGRGDFSNFEPPEGYSKSTPELPNISHPDWARVAREHGIIDPTRNPSYPNSEDDNPNHYWK